MGEFRLLDVDAAAGELGLPVWRLRELVTMGLLPCRRVGRRIYFTQGDLADGLARLAQPAREPERIG